MRLLIAGVLIAIPALGQQMISMRTSGDAAILTIRVNRTNYRTISGAPYSAKRITTGMQTRPDGNKVAENRTVLFYRDSAGRNRTERPVSIPGSPVMITIMDPTLGCEYVLDAGNKTAHKLIGVQVTTIATSELEKGGGHGDEAEGAPTTAPPGTARVQTENLGTQVLQGLEVHGSRTTTTWPAGTLNNNDHEIVTTFESWSAASLGGVVISSKTSRPQLTENYTVTDLKTGDPDPSLFAPPAGYRIVEESSDFQISIPQTSSPTVTKLSSHGPAPAAVSGAPFSGVRTVIATQTLADGTHEEHAERTAFIAWRDMQGRVRTEWPGQGILPVAVEIQDPIAGFSYSLDYAAKVARRVAFTPPSAGNAPPTGNSQSLGSQSISGVPASGIRTTTVRAPGSPGAATKPLNTVTETWTAGKEGIILLEKSTSSDGSGSTIEMKHFSTLEPDPSLFLIPATYRVVDENGNEIAAATAHPPTPPSADTRRTAPTMRPSAGESVFTFRVMANMNLPAITRAPYSVQNTYQTVRTLPDGTSSTVQSGTSTTATYRDSMGRTRNERPQGGFVVGQRVNASTQQPITLPEINDPVAGYRYILDPIHQIAHRTVVTTRRINSAAETPVAAPAMPPTSQTTPDGMTITSESLGTQTIDGLTAIGMRSTTQMPAGAQGNGQPMTMVNESWTSLQYGTVLRSTNRGQNNVTTSSAKDFIPAEPDPALFQPPREYKIVDENGDFSITIPRTAQ